MGLKKFTKKAKKNIRKILIAFGKESTNAPSSQFWKISIKVLLSLKVVNAIKFLQYYTQTTELKSLKAFKHSLLPNIDTISSIMADSYKEN